MTHGLSGYVTRKCRCPTCLAVGRAYFRERAKMERASRKAYEFEYRARMGPKERAAERRLAKREEFKTYIAEYREKNAAALKARAQTAEGKRKARQASQGRRARLRGQFIEDVDHKVVYEMHGGMCGICKEYIAEDRYDVDHVIPIILGGMHGYINVQPAHPFCNKSKGGRA